MKTVLVTGASGYIGSHVCKHLKQAGYKTIGIDRVRREHTMPFMDLFIKDDYDSLACLDVLGEHEPDAIVHLAGTSLVGPSMLNPAEYYINNVAKTASFLDNVRKLKKIPKIVFSSSAAVYGAPELDLIVESTPIDPLSPYGRSKAMIEQMLQDFHTAYNLNSISLRFFNACGADLDNGELGQEPNATHIIARLLESVRDHQPFTLFGNDYKTKDGTCIRDYVMVDDLARAHIMSLEYLENYNNVCIPINLGSSSGYSNQEIIDAVETFVGPVNLEHGARRPGDPDRLVASNIRAKTLLDWTPQYDLETIVKSAWKWYNKV